ncbi:MAG: zinc ribbon domain-containing protein [Promethearchaeota archaeon]|jgi:hypothetical protein
MYCPACGSNLSDEAEFCSVCGENLAKAKSLLDETSTLDEIPDLKVNIEFSLEGDISALYVNPNKVNKFLLKVKNPGLSPINNLNVKLSGPPYIELLTNLIKFEKIEANSTSNAPVRVIPRGEGIFKLTAHLQSTMGQQLSDSFELQSETPTSIEIENIPEQPTQKTYSYTQRTSGGGNQAVAVLVIFAFIGVILMISGGISFLAGGLPFSVGISFLVIGFIFISLGTKGKGLLLPCYCACDDCDCDC